METRCMLSERGAKNFQAAERDARDMTCGDAASMRQSRRMPAYVKRTSAGVETHTVLPTFESRRVLLTSTCTVVLPSAGTLIVVLEPAIFITLTDVDIDIDFYPI